jgi:TRAP-type C4-dicarboxylate transport system substrate-binding protein
MKKGSILILVFALLASLQMPQVSYGQEVVTLKMGDSFPIGHASHETAKFFIKRVEALIGNKVKIEYYPAEQMGKLKDYLNLCGSGILDMAYVPASFYAGQIPLNTVMILPYWTTAVEGGKIYQRIIETTPELTGEFMKYKVRPFMITCTSQLDVGTVKKAVRSPEDLKGMKLKTSGGLFDKIAIQYGVISVTIASPESYEAVQRGVVEGAIFAYPSAKGYRMNELEKYYTFGARMGGFPFVYVFNDKKWKTLSKDIQNALTAAARDYADYSGKEWDKQHIMLAEQFEKEGMTIYRIRAEERAKWDAPLKGIDEVWIKDLERRGLSGREVFESFKSASKEFVK